MSLRSVLATLPVFALAACGNSDAPTSEAPEATTAATATSDFGRDRLQIVGSSTVYPFATVVAENFGQSSGFNSPIVESTGSGGGLKLFCAGTGSDTPDITNASRRIKASEVELCASNGVDEIVEMQVGYDGIVLANSRKGEPMELSLGELYLALARDIPDGNGGFKPNDNVMWSDVSDALPARKIEVLGPPPTSGTRDAFVELAMEGGCKMFPEVAALKDSDKDAFKARCHTLREDDGFTEAGENDNLLIKKLDANTNAFGIFGYSYLDQNGDVIQAASINGVAPEFEAIASGEYPVARSLYVYLKPAHLGKAPGLQEFANEFVSDRAAGEYGYLADKGLIPMPEAERARVAADVRNMTPLKM